MVIIQDAIIQITNHFIEHISLMGKKNQSKRKGVFLEQTFLKIRNSLACLLFMLYQFHVSLIKGNVKNKINTYYPNSKLSNYHAS